jgi:hypothetical protein
MSPKLWFSIQIQMTCRYAGAAATVPHGREAADAGDAATTPVTIPIAATAVAPMRRSLLRTLTSG